jgi:predicted carbohydrate-binding protein with CBM5 and CBM33 domain
LYKDNADVLPSAESQNTPLVLSNFTSSHWIKPSHDPHELNAGEMTKTWDSEARHKSSSNE